MAIERPAAAFLRCPRRPQRPELTARPYRRVSDTPEVPFGALVSGAGPDYGAHILRHPWSTLIRVIHRLSDSLGEIFLGGARPSGDDVASLAMSPTDTRGGPVPRLTLPHGDPVAAELTLAIHGGDMDALRRLLAERRELASVRMIGRNGLEGGWRTPLHAAADWPGYFPAAPAAVALLLDAGADPNDDTGGDRPETALHWAASTDDVEVAAPLIDGGADLETPGGSIGTPLDNAIGYGCWHVARLLVERGAPVDALWHAAALGMLTRLDEILAATSPTAEDLNEAFWQACHGGQRRPAERLLAAGADINASPGYAHNQTALDAAAEPDTRRDLLATWLRERGAPSTPAD